MRRDDADKAHRPAERSYCTGSDTASEHGHDTGEADIGPGRTGVLVPEKQQIQTLALPQRHDKPYHQSRSHDLDRTPCAVPETSGRPAPVCLEPAVVCLIGDYGSQCTCDEACHDADYQHLRGPADFQGKKQDDERDRHRTDSRSRTDCQA